MTTEPRLTPPEASAVVVELLTMMHHRHKPKDLFDRIRLIPEEHRADIIGIAVGMLTSANELIAEMKGLPAESFLKVLGMGVAAANEDFRPKDEE